MSFLSIRADTNCVNIGKAHAKSPNVNTRNGYLIQWSAVTKLSRGHIAYVLLILYALFMGRGIMAPTTKPNRKLERKLQEAAIILMIHGLISREQARNIDAEISRKPKSP